MATVTFGAELATPAELAFTLGVEVVDLHAVAVLAVLLVADDRRLFELRATRLHVALLFCVHDVQKIFVHFYLLHAPCKTDKISGLFDFRPYKPSKLESFHMWYLPNALAAISSGTPPMKSG